MTRRMILANESTHADAPVEVIADAIDAQLHHYAKAWGSYVWDLTDAVNRDGWRIVLLDDSDQAGALGYHDVDPQGRPYARVFVNPTLNNGGSWVTGPNSVSVTVSHEALEVLGDPACNRWVDDWRGNLWAHEMCDVVEGDSYDVEGVSVSDFIYPRYFNPIAARLAGQPFDHLDLVTAPFEIRPGGYALRSDGASIDPVFGADYPRWKFDESKMRAGSRTANRYHAMLRHQ